MCIRDRKRFLQYDDSYRSRQRKKDREADRISRVEQDLADLKNLMQEIRQRPSSSTHPQADDPALDLSQRRSSVASTEVRANDQALLDDAPAPHYRTPWMMLERWHNVSYISQ